MITVQLLRYVARGDGVFGQLIAPRFRCFTVEDAYVFGCGMDYKGYWRGLRGIYAMEDR